MLRWLTPGVLLPALLAWTLPAWPAAPELYFHLPTKAALSVSANPVALGEAVALTASIRERGTGKPVSVGLLQIERAEAPEGPWVLLAQDVPDAAGNFELLDRASVLTPGLVWFRARYLGHADGQAAYGESVSPALPLAVKDYAGPPVELGVIHAGGEGEVGADGLGAWEMQVQVRVREAVDGLAVQAAGPGPRRWRLRPLDAGEEALLTIRLAWLSPRAQVAEGEPVPLLGPLSAVFRGADGRGRATDPVETALVWCLAPPFPAEVPDEEPEES